MTDKTVLQIQNTPSALDVVFGGVTLERQVSQTLSGFMGVTLDEVLFIDPRGSALAEKILHEGGYVATPSQGKDKVQPLKERYDLAGTVYIADHALAQGTADILDTYRDIMGTDADKLRYILMHISACYERGQMSGQMPHLERIAQRRENSGVPLLLVTGRSAAQILAAPYAPGEKDPADRLDEGMFKTLGLLDYGSSSTIPHFVEDGAVYLFENGTTKVNLPNRIKADVMPGIIGIVQGLLPELNGRYAEFTNDGEDPFYLPEEKQTRATINLPKSLRSHPQRGAIENEIIGHIKAYAAQQDASVIDRRAYR